MTYKTEENVKSAYLINSASQNKLEEKNDISEVDIKTSVPSKERLSQTEEEIQEEVVPEVSPVE